MARYIFVTGGNVSSIGKGIASASIGLMLKAMGYKITVMKIDPYLNVDAGTMNPLQHGEVFVTRDGAETDLDLGHYERFIDTELTRLSNVTTGQIYSAVLESERKGREHLGSTIQVIPHVTDEIKRRIRRVTSAHRANVIIVEIGGTVGDIESLPFLEAIRQFRNDARRAGESAINIHVTLIPYLSAAGELKTKLTQHSVKELRSIGIQPDIIICRTRFPLDDSIKAKISLFCDIEPEAVIQGLDADSIYDVPLMLKAERIDELVCRHLGLAFTEPDLTKWWKLKENRTNPLGKVKVAIVGKYTSLIDAYMSIAESLKHSAYAQRQELEISYINAETVTNENAAKKLKNVDGLLIPYGFGSRGMEGKISAIKHARENGMPFLGICFGLQCAVVEFARNVLKLAGANSTEYKPKCKHPVIAKMSEQEKVKDLGGTMRLGDYTAKLKPGTLARRLYGRERIVERHRHRWEVNNAYRSKLAKAGMIMCGTSPDRRLVEMIEIPSHPFFIATQAHPEFKSRPTRPHPLFTGFIKACVKERETGK
ncbi:CTP synthase [bacterium]|nr:CTP synthase [bacterium]